MFLALRGCEAGHWASWLPFPAWKKPQYKLSTLCHPWGHPALWDWLLAMQ